MAEKRAEESIFRKRGKEIRSTKTANEASELVAKMYMRGIESALAGRPISWVMVGCVAEVPLLAMDITPIYTENYATVCASRGAAEPFLEIAEGEGFSNLICGYARTGLGYAHRMVDLGGEVPPEAPLGGMAKPDMLIGCSTICDPRYKWYQSLGRYMNTPYYTFDVLWPPIDADIEAVKGYYVEYLLDGIRGLISFLEEVTGKKMDMERLAQIQATAEKTREVWWQVHELRKAVPAPMPAQDMLNCIVPGLFMPGEQEALDFYRKLYDEVKHRVDNKIGVIPDEKYRLLWSGGLPPWHAMGMYKYFETLGAVFVTEMAYNLGEPPQIPDSVTDPTERMALSWYDSITNYYERALEGCGDPQTQRILDFIEDYQIDGMVMHGSVSCRATTIGQINQKNMVQEHVKVPTLVIESDIIDARDFSEAQTKAQIDAFIDTVASYKESKRR